MKLTQFDMMILIEMINEKYEEAYLEYKEFNNSVTFSKMVDIEILRRKLYEMKEE